MADATTYEDDGVLWEIPPATRVDSVADRGANNVPLRRDTGPWGRHLCTRGVVPGPKFVPRAKRFNGHPAIYTDFLREEGPWDITASMLATCANPVDPTMWFNAPHGYDPTYLAAILCRPVNGVDWFGAWDACNGHIGTTATIGHTTHSKVSPMTDATIGPKSDPGKRKRCWGVTTSILIGDPWPSTDIEGDEDQTVLVLVKVDGEKSFMEIDWRDAGNKMQTDRTNFKLARRTAKEIFFGFVHCSYVAVAGLKLGSPAEAEIGALRDWAAPWMPATAHLALEP
jgi:hypothetical protein